MLFSIIVDSVGEKSIRLKIIGYEKFKVFCLIVKVEGIKLKSFVVLFRVKREIK